MRAWLLGLMMTLSSAVLADQVNINCPSISCSFCQQEITKSLSGMKGVVAHSIKFNVEKKMIGLTYQSEQKMSKSQIENAKKTFVQKLAEIGYPAQGPIEWIQN